MYLYVHIFFVCITSTAVRTYIITLVFLSLTFLFCIILVYDVCCCVTCMYDIIHTMSFFLLFQENAVKSEGKKRAADASKKAEQSGEVQVTSKPPQQIDEITNRPAKRSKGGGGAAGAEDDLEMVGTTGTAKLPHNRFACTEVGNEFSS